MDGFDQLIEEAQRADASRWDFGWLSGRATEERPSWRYFERVCERAGGVASLLEVQAGVGAMVATLPLRPVRCVATEGYAPSIALASPRLRAAGVHLVVTSQTQGALPFADGAFELVISRHPVEVWWDEVARVLRPGGSYLAQHVGPHSLRSLTEFFTGPLPDGSRRDPQVERRGAERAGLVIRRWDLERPRTVFHDIGAVVYLLRVLPWIVPGFDVTTHRDRLCALHEQITIDGSFETSASRMLIDATKPA